MTIFCEHILTASEKNVPKENSSQKFQSVFSLGEERGAVFTYAVKMRVMSGATSQFEYFFHFFVYPLIIVACKRTTENSICIIGTSCNYKMVTTMKVAHVLLLLGHAWTNAEEVKVVNASNGVVGHIRRHHHRRDLGGKEDKNGNNNNGGGGGGGFGGTTCNGVDMILEDGSTVSKCGVREKHPCDDFNSVSIARKSNIQTDECCKTNTCASNGGGCCRNYNYLVHDIKNDYPHLPCICNDYTYEGDNSNNNDGSVQSDVEDTFSPLEEIKEEKKKQEEQDYGSNQGGQKDVCQSGRNTNPCDDNAMCQSTASGVVICTCHEGWEGNGFQCKKKNGAGGGGKAGDNKKNEKAPPSSMIKEFDEKKKKDEGKEDTKTNGGGDKQQKQQNGGGNTTPNNDNKDNKEKQKQSNNGGNINGGNGGNCNGIDQVDIDGTTTISKCGIKEKHPCDEFDSVSSIRKDHVMSDSCCKTNTCSDGCCRNYSYLVHDTKNNYPHLACICNERTYGS